VRNPLKQYLCINRSLSLDIALGIGGLPRGRVIEIFGPEASGKTTLALQVVSEIQKSGGTAAFIDAEHALDVAYANKIGVKKRTSFSYHNRTRASRHLK
jgi:RecA/RadA recombinase